METVAHIISHTHWDREWYLNSPYTKEWLVPFFDSLFALLAEEADYRFVLDGQSCMIDDYLGELRRIGRDPAAAVERLRRFASSGRLVLGPYYLQPDWNLASDESLVRNLLIGIQDADSFGGSMRTGRLLDNFGQVSQTPQIHAGFGIADLFVWRGVEMDPHSLASEFRWRSPDGTEARGLYLVASYRNGMRLGEGGLDFPRRVAHEVDKVRPFATGPNVLLMNGYDQETEPENVLAMIRSSDDGIPGVRLKQSTPTEYAAAVRGAGGKLPVLSDALYGGSYIAVFPGVLSARAYLKTANDACQRLVERAAEPFSTMAWLLGAEYPAERLRGLWKRLLRNHPHDSICGVSVDEVHRDMERRFSAVASEASELARAAVAAVAASLEAEDGMPALLVLNPTPFAKRAVLKVAGETLGCRLPLGPDGSPLPSQRAADGGAYFLADSLPGFGYRSFPLTGEESSIYAERPGIENADAAASPVSDIAVAMGRALENAALRVELRDDGSLDVLDKRSGGRYSGVGVLEDGGDAGDTYDYSDPETDTVIHGSRLLRVSVLESGPLVASLKIEEELDIPVSLSADRSRRSSERTSLRVRRIVSLRSGEALLRIRLEVDNEAEDHRLRILFPLGASASRSLAGAPFDTCAWPIAAPMMDSRTVPETVSRVIIGARASRQASIFPFKRSVGIGSGDRGVIALAAGLSEFEVIRDGSVLGITLFRSVGWLARADLATRIGDAGPLMAVPDAQCRRTLDFSLGVAFSSEERLATDASSLYELFCDDYAAAVLRMDVRRSAVEKSFVSVKCENGLPLWSATKRSEAGDALVLRLSDTSRRGLSLALASDDTDAAFTFTRLDETAGENPIRAGRADVEAASIRTVQVSISPGRRRVPVGDRLRSIGGSLILSAENTDACRNVKRGLEVDDGAARKRLETIWAAERTRADEAEAEHRRAASSNDQAGDEVARLGAKLAAAGALRAALEARLSALLIEKRLLGVSEESEAELRSVGLRLNRARIEKRLLEYVRDCAENPGRP